MQELNISHSPVKVHSKGNHSDTLKRVNDTARETKKECGRDVKVDDIKFADESSESSNDIKFADDDTSDSNIIVEKYNVKV